LRGINLPDAPDVSGSCLLRYEVEAGVGGKIAQVGGRLVNGVAARRRINSSATLWLL
jgi:carbon monoxide dehydrogenase subunit G